VRSALRALGTKPLRVVCDLGCGTGASGAAWAKESGARYEGVEKNGWAVEEARFTLSALRLRGHAKRGDVDGAPLPGPESGILAAFTVNELDDAARERLKDRLLEAHAGGATLLVMEPLSRRVAPWWDAWQRSFETRGGRGDEWRFPAKLPATLRLLDKAAGLDHRKLLARSLWLPA
jgi:trans-aconitate methyltransferase